MTRIGNTFAIEALTEETAAEAVWFGEDGSAVVLFAVGFGGVAGRFGLARRSALQRLRAYPVVDLA